MERRVKQDYFHGHKIKKLSVHGCLEGVVNDPTAHRQSRPHSKTRLSNALYYRQFNPKLKIWTYNTHHKTMQS